MNWAAWVNPAKQALEWFVPLAGVGMPLLLGLVDLLLRIATPRERDLKPKGRGLRLVPPLLL